MIKINHKQARWLITCQLDHQVPEEQWTALQYHLEQCPECRDYQVHWQAQERHLRKLLQARWEPVCGPDQDLPQQIVSQRLKTTLKRRQLSILGVCLWVSTLLFLLAPADLRAQALETFIQFKELISESKVPTIPPTEKPLAVPIVKPGQFPHIVAYESDITGNTEIYLLNPGFEPVNITQNTAEDTFPTWSPDGEWLAFLSNWNVQEKGIGKNEIFVTSIAGNKLVQLTNDPQIDWVGPLSWSADGKWIAAAGMITDSSQQRSIYLIGVNGSGPHPLRDTLGGFTPKFSPYGERLAFHQVVGSLNRIVIYHTNTSQATFKDLAPLNNRPAEVFYDWAGDGDGLYYTVVQPYNSQRCYKMFIQQTQNQETSLEKLRDHFHLAEFNRIGNIHGISWAPNNWIIYLAATQKPEYEVRQSEKVLSGSNFFFYHLEEPNPATIHTDLCIQGNLDRGSWSLDMRWVTFSGRIPGTADTEIYAVRMPGLDLDWKPIGSAGLRSTEIPVGNVFRLSAASKVTSSPQMRPFHREMKIEPYPYPVETIRSRTITDTYALHQQEGYRVVQFDGRTGTSWTSVPIQTSPPGVTFYTSTCTFSG